MNILGYGTLFILLLLGLVEAITQMGFALDEEDIESFSIWTGIASIIAALPIVL